jgi:UDP-N-acetylglucosamine 4-epimerase
MPGGILVTGAAGFIGSHLCDALIRAGETVVALDDLSDGRRENVVHLLSQPRFRFVEGSILDSALVERCTQDTRAVMHLAAQVSVQRSFEDPKSNERVNCEGFLNCLHAAGRAKCEAFLYASSCAVYGDSNALPLREDATLRPLSPYAETKLMNEYDAATLASKFPNMSLIGLRFFNIFGPRQNATGSYASVIARWIKARVIGERPVIFGDGLATRDFCFVGNVTEFLTRAEERTPRPGNWIVNIGTGIATNLLHLDAEVRAIGALRGYGPDFPLPRHESSRQGDIEHSVADIGLLKREFNFEPRYSLVQGLTDMYDHVIETSVCR